MGEFKLNKALFIRNLNLGLSILWAPVFLHIFIIWGNIDVDDYKDYLVHFILIFFNIFIVMNLASIPYLFLKKLGAKIYLFILFFTLYLSAVIDVSHLLLFSVPIQMSTFIPVFSTNAYESVDFVMDYSSLAFFMGIFIWFALVYLLHRVSKAMRLTKRRMVLYFLLVLIALVQLIPRWNVAYINEISLVKLTQSYLGYRKELKQLSPIHLDLDKLYISQKVVEKPETHIVIIGESTSVFHMSLYGYDRQTNPLLESIKNQLLVFKYVNSTHAYTIGSLKDVFHLRDSANVPNKFTIIDVLNKAGYSSYWLSNQRYFEETVTPITEIANRSDKVYFANPLKSIKYDGDLLLKLKTVLAADGSKKIIFIHLMGTHSSYKDRYPEKYNVFKDPKDSKFGIKADRLINYYDNAVLYNDFVVSSIISQADAVEGLSSVVYFSDHGEEIYDTRDFFGHNDALLPSEYMTRIPFLVWLNDDFKDARSGFMKRVLELDKVFTMHNFSHTYQDLLGIESTFDDPTKSFFYTEKP